MRLKNGVKPRSLQPQVVLAILVADSIYRELGKECVVTSLNDGSHSYNSLHWSGNAVDFRIRHLDSGQPQLVRDRLASAVGVDYDVVLESDHIHLEYQPKGK